MKEEFTFNLELFNQAAIFAVEQHSKMVRKGDKRPYILHPFSVAKRIFDNGFENPYLKAIVSMLHDVIEDVYKDNYEEGFRIIREKFGDRVADLVGELTLNKAKYSELGKDKYLLEELTNMSSDALDIKLCDRLDNVSEMENMKPDFQIYYSKHTKYIFDNLKRDLTEKQLKVIDEIMTIVSSYELPKIN